MASDDELDVLLDEYSADQALTKLIDDRQKKRHARIMALMNQRHRTEYETPAGTTAVIVIMPTSKWDLEKLRAALDPTRFEIFCPRKPDAVKLKSALDIDPDLAGTLERCRKVSESAQLRVAPRKQIT